MPRPSPLWRRAAPALALLAGLDLHAVNAGELPLEEVIVTAQKRSENLQDVPISVTAFDAAALSVRQIATAADLRYSAPNISYTQGNFTSSNFKIRGVGQDLVAATADPGVGIHVNDVPILAPRLYETEYYDIKQLVILRGPQGTLYGRNSTGGALNMITNPATTEALEGNLEGTYGNYDTALFKGMVNVPLGATLAARFAGISLNRDGYTDNVATGNDVDDRDQWSVRGSLQWLPTDRTTVNLMASYLDENSSRMRSPKQLCQNDPSALLGCLPDRLATEAVNPLAQLPWVLPNLLGPFGPQPARQNSAAGVPADMRKIAANFDPGYKADEKLVILRLDQEMSDYQLAAIGGYQHTSVRSRQDFDMIADTIPTYPSPLLQQLAPVTWQTYYSDNTLPISAPSKTNTGIVGGNIAYAGNSQDGYDQSTGSSKQYSAEFNLSSDYDGPVNFLAGLFYLSARTDSDYWVFGNALDYFAVVFPAIPVNLGGLVGQDGVGWVSPSFHSQTKSYELDSAAAFGELYYQFTDELKLTTGLRWTRDEKHIHDRQYALNLGPDGSPIVQPFGENADFSDLVPGRKDKRSWEEWTGRVVLDWSPQLAWSDASLFYVSYARGYKGGGFNPAFDPLEVAGVSPFYQPEFVNAFELGAKTRLLDQRLQSDLTAFYYDYDDLQISKTVNRSSFTENTNAEIYGLEAELLFAPTDRWLLNANLAWLHTAIKNFSSVDPRDPTQGSSEATLLKDMISAANCVVFHNGAPPPDMPGSNSCTNPTLANGTPLPAPYTVGDGVEADLDGNELRNAPENTVNLGAQYTWPLGRTELAARVDYYWQDSMWGREYNRDPVDKIGSFDVWNAQATLSAADGSWYVQAFVKNIENDDATVGMFVSDPASGLFTNVFLIEPRLYGLALGYNF